MRVDRAWILLAMTLESTRDGAAAQSLEGAWDERGWPRELLDDARKAAIADSELRRWLMWNPPLEGMELRVKWEALLLEGRIRFRQVTVADDDAFRELWANSSEAILPMPLPPPEIRALPGGSCNAVSAWARPTSRASPVHWPSRIGR